MRITIQITCDDVKDAQDVIARLSRPKNWTDMVETKTSEPKSASTPAPAPRLNVSPGESKLTKIGGETREMLLKLIKDNEQPAEKWIEHCRLLWSRNEIKFDGMVFYV